MTPEQTHELEQRLRARGLSRKGARDAVAVVREWLQSTDTAAVPGVDNDADVVVETAELAAATLLRSLQRD